MLSKAVQSKAEMQILGSWVLITSEMTNGKMTDLFFNTRSQHTDGSQGYKYTLSCYFRKVAVILGSKWAKAECGPLKDMFIFCKRGHQR